MQRFITVLLMLILFSSGMAIGKTPPKTLSLNNVDNKAAVIMISKFLVLNGLEVTLDPKALNKGEMLVLKYNKQPIFMAPRLNNDKDRIDRLIFYQVFHIKKGVAGTSKIITWLMNMNARFNFATFAKTRGMVVVTSQMTFLNHLDIKEVNAFLKDLQLSLAQAMMVSSASKYLQ